MPRDEVIRHDRRYSRRRGSFAAARSLRVPLGMTLQCAVFKGFQNCRRVFFYRSPPQNRPLPGFDSRTISAADAPSSFSGHRGSTAPTPGIKLREKRGACFPHRRRYFLTRHARAAFTCGPGSRVPYAAWWLSFLRANWKIVSHSLSQGRGVPTAGTQGAKTYHDAGCSPGCATWWSEDR